MVPGGALSGGNTIGWLGDPPGCGGGISVLHRLTAVEEARFLGEAALVHRLFLEASGVAIYRAAEALALLQLSAVEAAILPEDYKSGAWELQEAVRGIPDIRQGEDSILEVERSDHHLQTEAHREAAKSQGVERSDLHRLQGDHQGAAIFPVEE